MSCNIRKWPWLAAILLTIFSIGCPGESPEEEPDEVDEPPVISLTSEVIVDHSQYTLRFEVVADNEVENVRVGRANGELQELQPRDGGFEHELTLDPRKNDLVVEVIDSQELRGRLETTIYFDAEETLLAHFTASGSMEVGEPLSFDASGSRIPYGEEAEYFWRLGDGTTRRGPVIDHVYANSRIHIMELTIITDFGGESQRIANIEIGGDGGVTGEVIGVARSEDDGTVIEGVDAAIYGSDTGAEVDTHGHWHLTDVPVGWSVPLTVQAEGFLERIVTVELTDDAPYAELDVTLIPEVRQTRKVARVDETIETDDGAVVELSNTEFVDSTGESVDGELEVRVTVVDPTTAPGSVPGSASGVGADGEWQELQFVSAGLVEFYVDEQPVEPAPGESVNVVLPLFSGDWQDDDAPRIWNLIPSQGVWFDEGTSSVVEISGDDPGVGAEFALSSSGWWTVAEPVLQPGVLAIECEVGPGVEVFDEGDEVAGEEGGDELPCYVLLESDGWTRSATVVEETTREITVPSGEVCLRAKARGGLCSFESCVAVAPEQTESVALNLGCRDEDAEMISYGDNRTFNVDVPEGDEESFEKLYAFAGEVEDGAVVRLQHEGNTAGQIRLLDRSGQVVESAVFGDGESAIGIPLPRTGIFLVELRIDEPVGGEATVALEKYPVVEMGETISTSIPDGEDEQFYLFAVDEGQMAANALHFSDLSIRVADLFERTMYHTGYYFHDDMTGVFGLPEPGAYLLDVRGNAGMEYDLTLLDIDEPAELEFETDGRARVQESYDTYGAHRFYEFDAEAGDGVAIDLRGMGADAVQAAGKLGIHVSKKGDGEFFDAEDRLRWATYDRAFFERSDAWQFRVEESGTYIVEVYHIELSDTGIELGDYELIVDRVASFDEALVGDENNCPDADARSLRAATLGANEDAEISLCEGLFEWERPLLLQTPGVQISGVGREDSIIRHVQGRHHRLPHYAVIVNATDVTLEDLAVEYEMTAEARDSGGHIIGDYELDSQGDYAAGLTLQRVNLLGVNSGPHKVGAAVRLTRESDELWIRDVRTEEVNPAIYVRSGTGIVIEDSEFLPTTDNSTYGNVIRLRNLGSADVLRNTISAPAARCLQASFDDSPSSRVLRIEDNICNRGEARDSIRVNGTSAEESGSRHVEIVGNQISGDRRSTSGTVTVYTRRPPLQVLVEGNNIDADGGSALRLAFPDLSQDDTIEATVSNNVIRNAGNRWNTFNFESLTPESKLLFVNNSVDAREFSSSWWHEHTTVRLEPHDEAAPGALPITIANNLFSMPEDIQSTGIKYTGVEGEITIDADHNLYFNHDQRFADVVSSTGTNDIEGEDPLFISDDLDLDPSSPAIDAGSCEFAPSEAIDGTPRPQDGSCDLGAYEQ